MEGVDSAGTIDRYSDSVDPDPSPDSEQELLLFERRGNDDLEATVDVGVGAQESGRETQAEREGGISLKREITPLSGVGFVVGSLIGSGIFITPSVILNYSGSFGVSMACWVFGALVALAGALCYFELGMVVRKTGGEYAIFLEAYSFHKKNACVEMIGSMVSFLYTWTSVLVLKSSSASIITLACARYLIRPFFIGCDIPDNSVKLLALAIISKYHTNACTTYVSSWCHIQYLYYHYSGGYVYTRMNVFAMTIAQPRTSSCSISCQCRLSVFVLLRLSCSHNPL